MKNNALKLCDMCVFQKNEKCTCPDIRRRGDGTFFSYKLNRMYKCKQGEFFEPSKQKMTKEQYVIYQMTGNIPAKAKK